MSFLDYGQDPVGYRYKAENVPFADVWRVIQKDKKFHRFYWMFDPAYIDPTFQLSDMGVRFMAEALGIEYDDPRSYADSEFPKPIYLEQLTCTDDWAGGLKPDHQWGPLGHQMSLQKCVWCGKKRITT